MRFHFDFVNRRMRSDQIEEKLHKRAYKQETVRYSTAASLRHVQKT